MSSIHLMRPILWTDSSQNGIQSVYHQINFHAVSSMNVKNELLNLAIFHNKTASSLLLVSIPWTGHFLLVLFSFILLGQPFYLSPASPRPTGSVHIYYLVFHWTDLLSLEYLMKWLNSMEPTNNSNPIQHSWNWMYMVHLENHHFPRKNVSNVDIFCKHFWKHQCMHVLKNDCIIILMSTFDTPFSWKIVVFFQSNISWIKKNINCY